MVIHTDPKSDLFPQIWLTEVICGCSGLSDAKLHQRAKERLAPFLVEFEPQNYL